MTDAGYTFDFDKKELKKIVTPIFNIGDTIIKKHNSDINDFGSFTITDITGGKYWYNDRIICDITEQDEWELYEPVRQNPAAWSEEDEKMLEYALDMIEWYSGKNEDKSRLVSDWPKSLRPQNTWKPSDEQIEVLEMVLTNESMDDNIAIILRELREQLKKLKRIKL